MGGVEKIFAVAVGATKAEEAPHDHSTQHLGLVCWFGQNAQLQVGSFGTGPEQEQSGEWINFDNNVPMFVHFNTSQETLKQSMNWAHAKLFPSTLCFTVPMWCGSSACSCVCNHSDEWRSFQSNGLISNSVCPSMQALCASVDWCSSFIPLFVPSSRHCACPGAMWMSSTNTQQQQQDHALLSRTSFFSSSLLRSHLVMLWSSLCSASSDQLFSLACASCTVVLSLFSKCQPTGCFLVFIKNAASFDATKNVMEANAL